MSIEEQLRRDMLQLKQHLDEWYEAKGIKTRRYACAFISDFKYGERDERGRVRLEGPVMYEDRDYTSITLTVQLDTEGHYKDLVNEDEQNDSKTTNN